MIPRRILLVSTLVFAVLASLNTERAVAQEGIERLMTRRLLTCHDVTYNCAVLIPEYFNAGKMDTVEQLLNYWESMCGRIEPLVRTRILIGLHQGTFSEILYDSTIIDHLVDYRELTEGLERSSPWYKNYLIFTHQLASSLTVPDPQSAEYVLSRFYCGEVDSLGYMMRSLDPEKYLLRKYYDSYCRRLERESEGHLALIAGSWVPLGKNKVLGAHPAMGFSAGFKRMKTSADFTLVFRFLPTPNTYYVRKNGELHPTTHFFGGYIAIEFGRELYRRKLDEVDVLAGVGYDGFDAIDKPGKGNNKSVNSLNLNYGLGFRRYVSASGLAYVGVQVRYNYVWYKSGGGTDLSGNALSIHLAYGWAGNVHKARRKSILE